MALLHRFSKLNDRSNTGIFTFIVTRSVTRDLHRDATTKDFYYGYHRWAISFTRANDKVLGVYLILRDTSPLAITYTDYSITLLNRIHFSRNEQYGEKQCKFSSDHPAHGINKWIPLGDIQTRNFGDETGEFLLELNLSNLMTVFETQICLHSLAGSGGQNGGNPGGQTSSAPSNNPANPPAPTFKNGKLETSYFHYGTFEWNISILMHNASSGGAASMVRGLFKDSSNSQDQEPLFNARNANSGQGGGAGSKSNRSYLLFLNRLTGFENACRIQYRIVLGQDQLREDTGIIEQMSDMNGRTRGYQIDQHTFAQLTSMGMVNLYFEFYCCNPISEAKVPITRSISPTINCYDRNKQGWSIESDVEGEHLKLKLYFMDMHSVPRNHLRYVSWFTYVIVNQDSSSTSSSTAASSGSNQTASGSGPLGSNNVMVKNSPHYNYYIQDGIDMGVVMETDILVADIKSSGKKYLENDTNLTVHVEWYDSIMLFNHIYHKYDDIARMHCHQMRREISALSSENYSLERQMFAYQRSISMANNQINVQTNSMARLSISSPSKPAPPTSINHCGGGQSGGTGFGSPSSSSSAAAAAAVAAAAYHRSSNPQLDTSYFNATDEISSISGGSDGGSAGGGYYLSDHHQSHRRPETINYATTGPDRTMGGTPLATSPMQPPPPQQQPSLAQYLGSTLDGCTPAISTRHSFSGPATPQHHAQYLSHHHHRQQQQQQSQLVQTPSLSPYVTTPGGGYHHQLAQAGAAGAGQMSYTTTTGYRLRSPSSNPNIAQMYHQDDLSMAQSTAGAGGMVMDATDDGSVDDAYQAYSGQYKLTV